MAMWQLSKEITITKDMSTEERQTLALALDAYFGNKANKNRRILNFFALDGAAVNINHHGETQSVRIKHEQIITKRFDPEKKQVYYEVSGKLLGTGLYGWVYGPGFRIIPNEAHDDVDIVEQEGDMRQVIKIQQVVEFPRKGLTKEEEKDRILTEETSVRDVYQKKYKNAPIEGFDFDDNSQDPEGQEANASTCYRISFMPFFEGQDLGHYSVDDLNYTERVFLMTAILEAYVMLEEEKVVHQDPKIDNIIFNKKDWQAFFADFGHSHKRTDPYRYDGTIKHMPPEMEAIGEEVKANIKANKPPLASPKSEYYKMDYYFLAGVLGSLFNAKHIYLNKKILVTMGGFGHAICRILSRRNPAHVDLRKLSASQSYNFSGMFQGLAIPKSHKEVLAYTIKSLGENNMADRPDSIVHDVLPRIKAIQQQCLRIHYMKMKKATNKARTSLVFYLDKHKYKKGEFSDNTAAESMEWKVTKAISEKLKNKTENDVDSAINTIKAEPIYENVDFTLVKKMVQIDGLLEKLVEREQLIDIELKAEDEALCPKQYEAHYFLLKDLLTNQPMLKALNEYRTDGLFSWSGLFNTIAKPFSLIIKLFYSAEDNALIANTGYVWSSSANSVYYGLKQLRDAYYHRITSDDVSYLEKSDIVPPVPPV